MTMPHPENKVETKNLHNGNNTAPSAQITLVDSTQQTLQLMGDVVYLPDSANTQQPKKTTKK